jgi:hypothetical protein
MTKEEVLQEVDMLHQVAVITHLGGATTHHNKGDTAVHNEKSTTLSNTVLLHHTELRVDTMAANKRWVGINTVSKARYI